jgi:hypothetical protein
MREVVWGWWMMKIVNDGQILRELQSFDVLRMMLHGMK